MRIAFLGNAPASVASLEALAGSRHELTLVATRAARPAGRGRKLRPTPVAEAAQRLSLPLVEIETVKRGEGLEALRRSAPDVLVVVAYGEIIPIEVLEVPSIAPVNLHFSLLPELRGADPVRRAILDGLHRTGVTTMRMDEGLDTGPILLQREEPIRPDDDAGTLLTRLAHRGAALLLETLDALERGGVVERPQDERLATLAPKLRPDEEVVGWSSRASVIVRCIRALSPVPGARTVVAGRVLKVLRAREVPSTGEPGSVLEVSPELVVAAAQDAVAVEEVVPEGRRRMTGAEFARGRRLQPGMRLG